MARNANLASEHTIFANLGGTRYACLCRYHGIMPDFHVMRYLYQVVQFRTT